MHVWVRLVSLSYVFSSWTLSNGEIEGQADFPLFPQLTRTYGPQKYGPERKNISYGLLEMQTLKLYPRATEWETQE